MLLERRLDLGRMFRVASDVLEQTVDAHEAEGGARQAAGALTGNRWAWELARTAAKAAGDRDLFIVERLAEL